MPTSASQFFMEGTCEDRAYLNTRDESLGIDAKRFVEDLWSRFQFQHLADPHFREDARNHFLQRCWEMYLAVTLLEHGFDLRRHGDEGPEFYADIQGHRVWFEAVAPGPGLGADCVPQLVPGQFAEVPIERILLRFTNALEEKRHRYAAATTKGIVAPKDCYVLAINSRGIRHAPYAHSMPHFVQAFLAVGPLAVDFDVKTGEIIDSRYLYRPSVSKANAASVSTSAFLGQEAAFCSAVLHSGVDCANHPEQLGGDFSVLHNPSALLPLDQLMFSWCEEFRIANDTLLRTKPNSSLQRPDGSRGSPSAAER